MNGSDSSSNRNISFLPGIYVDPFIPIEKLRTMRSSRATTTAYDHRSSTGGDHADFNGTAAGPTCCFFDTSELERAKLLLLQRRVVPTDNKMTIFEPSTSTSSSSSNRRQQHAYKNVASTSASVETDSICTSPIPFLPTRTTEGDGAATTTSVVGNLVVVSPTATPHVVVVAAPPAAAKKKEQDVKRCYDVTRAIRVLRENFSKATSTFVAAPKQDTNQPSTVVVDEPTTETIVTDESLLGEDRVTTSDGCDFVVATTNDSTQPTTTTTTTDSVRNESSSFVDSTATSHDTSTCFTRHEKKDANFHILYQHFQDSMRESAKSQLQLQAYDHEMNGLPKSHSPTMVKSSRSRRQLQEGVVLPKWDGTPLIDNPHCELGQPRKKRTKKE